MTATAELAVRPDVEALNADRVALIKRTICKGASDDELAMFVETAKRLQLDPFARQVFAVKRWDSREKREVMAIQVSIDGFRLVAERTGKYAGQLGPFWTGDGKEWVEVWLGKSPPAAAKVAVLRSDFKEPLWAVATWDQYKQTRNDGKLTAMWERMGALMLAKCAESLALRRAFPNELSGVYTQEEMAQATVETPEAPPSTLARFAEHVGETTPPPPEQPRERRPAANTIKHDGKMATPDQVRLLHTLKHKLGLPECAGPDVCSEAFQQWSNKQGAPVDKVRWCPYHTQLLAFRDQAGERVRTSKDLSQAQISNLIDRYQAHLKKHDAAREQKGPAPDLADLLGPEPTLADLVANMRGRGIEEAELCGTFAKERVLDLTRDERIMAGKLVEAWDTDRWELARDQVYELMKERAP